MCQAYKPEAKKARTEMAVAVPTPRSRGSLCGLALVLLGAWGALAPYLGPYFGYGFTPDRAWDNTSGRLYLSALPGAVVLITGLMLMMTRSRGFGVFCAFIAALGGAWFIAGSALVALLPASVGNSILASAGLPIGTTRTATVLDSLGLYRGTGAVIVFFAALAMGRFSIAAHKDHERFAAGAAGVGGAAGIASLGTLGMSSSPTFGQPGQSNSPTSYPPAPDQPTHTRYGGGQSDYPQEQFPQEQYPQQQYPSQYPSGQDTFPQEHPTGPDQSPPTQTMYPGHDDSFPPAQP
jgi:hypothetical protein